MSDWGNLLRSGWKHAKRSRQFAAQSMLEAVECCRVAASTYEKVMEAAQPFLIEADFWATLAGEAAKEARHFYKKCLVFDLGQPVSVN